MENQTLSASLLDCHRYFCILIFFVLYLFSFFHALGEKGPRGKRGKRVSNHVQKFIVFHKYKWNSKVNKYKKNTYTHTYIPTYDFLHIKTRSLWLHAPKKLLFHLCTKIFSYPSINILSRSCSFWYLVIFSSIPFSDWLQLFVQISVITHLFSFV